MPRLPHRRARAGSSYGGFTLIELLTSLALMGLVAGAIATAFSGSIRVRQVVQAQTDELGEVHALARSAREDLTHVVAVPGAFVIEGETLAMLLVLPSGRDEERDDHLAIVRYRRDASLEGSGSIVREVIDVDPRALLDWSERSLGTGARSVLPRFVAPERSTPVFRLGRPVEWKPLEYENGEWRVSDGENPSAVRAIDLRILSADGSPNEDPGRQTGIGRAWTIRIPLPIRPSERVGS